MRLPYRPIGSLLLYCVQHTNTNCPGRPDRPQSRFLSDKREAAKQIYKKAPLPGLFSLFPLSNRSGRPLVSFAHTAVPPNNMSGSPYNKSRNEGQQELGEGKKAGERDAGLFYDESDTSSVEILTGVSKVEAAQAVW